jgi:hypothetical protein
MRGVASVILESGGCRHDMRFRRLRRAGHFVICAGLAAACGGSDFNGIGGDAGTDADAGAFDVTGTDGAVGEGGGPDVTADAPADATADVTGDAPPPSCPMFCIQAPPPGWRGLVELYSGSGPAPACGGAFTGMPVYDGRSGLDAPPASCMCSCGTPTGVSCPAAAILFYAQSCNGAPCLKATLPNGACTTLDPTVCGGGGATLPVEIDAPTPTGGSCTGMGSASIAPATWQTTARACALATPPTMDGCGQGQLCVPPAEKGFAPTLCVAHDGDVPCPGSPFTLRAVYYGGFDDTRACSACGCDPPQGAACTGSARRYASIDGTCSAQVEQDSLPLACGTTTRVGGDWRIDSGPSGGSCNTSGGQPTGAATPKNATTFCCAL